MKGIRKKRTQLIGRFLLLIILMITWVIPVSAYSIPAPTNDFYVNDCAGLLSDDSYNYIMNVNVELQKKTKAQVVVATIESLDGADLEQYATEMFRKYKIGDKEENNGILILLAYKERKLRIEVGYGLEGAINDAKAGRIMDNYMIPYLKDDLWDEGIVNGFDAVVQEICSEYDVEIAYNEPVRYSGSETGNGILLDGETIIYMVLLIIIVIIAVVSTINGSGGSSGGGSYRSSSGGFGGGGGFSGGGGSSGGGGASRGF